MCVGSTRLYLLEWRWRHPGAGQQANARINAQVPLYPISVYIDIRVAAAAGADDDCVGFRFNKYIPGSLQPSITVAVANDRRNKSFAHHTIRYYGDEPKDFFKWFSFLFPPPQLISFPAVSLLPGNHLRGTDGHTIFSANNSDFPWLFGWWGGDVACREYVLRPKRST